LSHRGGVHSFLRLIFLMYGRLLVAAGLLLPCAAQKEVQAPIPPAIQKIICQFASLHELEDDVSEEVCKEVTKLFPSIKFDPDCKTVLEELWDTGLALFCPQPNRTSSLAKVTDLPPIPPAVQKLICALTGNKDIEDETTGAVCAEVKKVFPDLKFDPDCQTVIEALWDTGHTLLCPAVQPVVHALPTPQDIEKMVCSVASSKDIEDKAVGAICDKIVAQFPDLAQYMQPDCPTFLEGIWDIIVAMCPAPGPAQIVV